ncbi:MAG: hypothetical protein K9N06_09555 [Candidatus Cloacimonetes bacterium]|nr:hypothetical protein [Candidatus Cloacimonadota bacterium]
MKNYYTDKSLVVPYEKVLFCQWHNELGEHILKVNFTAVQGSDSFWKLSLTGEEAESFLKGYIGWLDNRSRLG